MEKSTRSPITEKKERWVHRLFLAGVVSKGVNAAWEFASGLLVLAVRPMTAAGMLFVLAQWELAENPASRLADRVENLAYGYTIGKQLFVGIYLLAHGIINGTLVLGLLRRKLWVFPTAMTVFALFIVYQMSRFARHPSASMIVLSIIDAVVITLTWLEWRRLRRDGWA